MSASSASEQERKQLFLEGLRSIIPSLKLHNDATIEKRIGKEKCQLAADELAGYLLSGGCDKMMKNEQLALVGQIMNCLSRFIALEMKLPVTLNTVLSQMSMLSYAVDQAFPGYARSGLLRYTIAPPRTAA